jgi:protein involved in polysaccharide export with SLBB domain
MRVVCLLWVPLLTGCIAAPGMTLFPEGHHLLFSTRKLRQQAPWPIPRELDKQPLPPYTVEPGDVLLIQPADLDSPVRIPGDQPVLPDGSINLGRFGHLVVAGRTIPEIEIMVREAVASQVSG